jgi:hypothetical protein
MSSPTLTMTKAEREQFRSVAERDPPKRQVKELWVVAGRRAGKDSIAAAIATHAAISADDFTRLLRPGELAAILYLAWIVIRPSWFCATSKVTSRARRC